MVAYGRFDRRTLYLIPVKPFPISYKDNQNLNSTSGKTFPRKLCTSKIPLLPLWIYYFGTHEKKKWLSKWWPQWFGGPTCYGCRSRGSQKSNFFFRRGRTPELRDDRESDSRKQANKRECHEADSNISEIPLPLFPTFRSALYCSPCSR